MEFKEAKINGVYVADLPKFVDDRGWLAELWRTDWLEKFGSTQPEMCYVSMTEPGVSRGPHEHKTQTDYFTFIGPGNFKLMLWDNRKESPTYGAHIKMFVGEDNRKAVVVPPGVVHGYKNPTSIRGLVINFADVLFAGKDKKEPVDEIRHEEDENSPFDMEA